MELKYLVIPVVGAMIGWITNLMAIKLIFYPRQAFKIPVINWQIQGLLPKRKVELARSIGVAIEEELLPVEFLQEQLEEMEIKAQINERIIMILQEKLEDKIPLFLPDSWRENLQNLIINWAKEELENNLDEIITFLSENFLANNSLSEMVEKRILGFDLDHLEKLVYKVASKELKHIEVLGGVLGFIIGVFQVVFLMYV